MPRRRSNLGRRTRRMEIARRVIANQTEEERASATERARQRRAQIRAEQAAERRAVSLEDAPLRARRSRSDMASVSKDSPKKRHISGILNRKTSNMKSRRNQSTDVNTSDVQPRKKHLRKTPLASRSKPQPVKASNSKDSSINTSSNRGQKLQLLKLKSPSNRNIQKNKRTVYVDDEFDICAKRIAFQLRLLPYYNAGLCQEKIKRIINQERFNVQQPRHQEKETIIIKPEPGLSEEEFINPVSSPETMRTIITEELV